MTSLKALSGLLDLPAGNPGPLTGAGNHTYLLTGRVPTLIDAGVGDPAHLEAVARALPSGVGLTQVIITHAHNDHASGAPALAARWPAVRFRKIPWPERDAGSGVRWHPLEDGTRIPAGDHELEIVHTPGHAPDHACLWHAPTRTLFGGDLLVAGSTVLVPGGRGGDLAAYLASLTRVRRMDPHVVLPAHGSAIRNPSAVVARYLAHRADREGQILAALEAGDGSVASIVARVYPEVMPALRPAAEMTVRAHLEKLRNEGRVTGEDGALTIRP